MKPKKKFKKRYVILPLLVIAIVAIVIKVNMGKGNILYQEETATARDIVNYLEFSGNVTAAEVKNVYSDASAKILEVFVEEGDAVKKGDVICKLDTSDIEYSIEAKELSLKQANVQNYYTLKDAKTNLSNLEDSLAQGMNSSVNQSQKALLSAQEQFLSAAEQYNKAMKTYKDAKSDLDNERTASIVQAKQSLEIAQNSLSTAEFNNNNSTDLMGNKVELSDEEKSYNTLSSRTSVSQAEEKLKMAREDAKKQVEEYKKSAEDAYERYEKAEEDLAAAQKDYEVTLYSVQQNIQTYQDTIEKLQATASTASTEMDIQHTKESLDDYIVYAPIDGYITTLSIKEGERLNSAAPVGVITNFDEMEISINIDEYDIATVREGSEVEIYINALDSYYPGTIKSISKTATKTGDVSYVSATVSFEPAETVMSGLSAEVKLVKNNEKNVVTLSEECISYDESHMAYVLIKGEDGTGVKTPVTLGVSDGNYVQIISGVKENDIILYVPKVTLPYGMMVNME